MSDVVETILKEWGATGAMLLMVMTPMVLYIRSLHSQLSSMSASLQRAHESRVSADAELREALIESSRTYGQTASETARAIEQLRGAIQRLELRMERIESVVAQTQPHQPPPTPKSSRR